MDAVLRRIEAVCVVRLQQETEQPSDDRAQPVDKSFRAQDAQARSESCSGGGRIGKLVSLHVESLAPSSVLRGICRENGALATKFGAGTETSPVARSLARFMRWLLDRYARVRELLRHDRRTA